MGMWRLHTNLDLLWNHDGNWLCFRSNLLSYTLQYKENRYLYMRWGGLYLLVKNSIRLLDMIFYLPIPWVAVTYIYSNRFNYRKTEI